MSDLFGSSSEEESDGEWGFETKPVVKSAPVVKVEQKVNVVPSDVYRSWAPDAKFQSVMTKINALRDKHEEMKENTEPVFRLLTSNISFIFDSVGADGKDFFVDLDSLIIDCVSNKILDQTTGPQHLGVVAFIENTLLKLFYGARTLQIVAFDVLEVIWTSPSERLTRTLVLEHLMASDRIQVTRFPSWEAPEWTSYCQRELPSFVAVCDGRANSPLETHLFSHMVTSLMTISSIDVVASSQLTFESNALYGFSYVFTGNDVNEVAEQLEKYPLSSVKLLDELKADEKVSADALKCANDWIKEGILPAHRREHMHLVLYACLKNKSLGEAFIQSVLFTAALSIHCPLSWRASLIDRSPYQKANDLDRYTKLSQSMLELFPIDTKDQMVCDILDSNYRIKLAALGIFKLPKENDVANQLFDKMCSAVFGKPIKVEKSINIHATNVPSNLRDKPIALTNFDSMFVTSLVGDVNTDLKKESLIATRKELPAGKLWKEPIVDRSGQEGQERLEWVSDALIHDGIQKEKVAKTKREKRSNAKLMTFMTKYCQSLKGGKIVLRDVIVANTDEKKKKSEKKNAKKGHKRSKKQKNKPKKLTKAQIIINKNAEKMKAAEKQNLQLVVNHASSFKQLEEKISELDNKLNDASSLSLDITVGPVIQLHEWQLNAYRECKVDQDIKPAVRLWQSTHDIFRRYLGYLSISQVQQLQIALIIMGFTGSAEAMAEIYYQHEKKRPPAESMIKSSTTLKDILATRPRTETSYPVGVPCSEFQLRHAGHLMVRSVASAPDARVSGFYPDAWQRRLLDIVDNKESALVVAPTSAGKTFISYYAMKQILKSNKTTKKSTEKRYVVYVCPTQALSTQIAADVYQRYGPVFGAYTKNWKYKIIEADVLVTVPELFEQLLLSPDRQQWIQQIGYVIFDEVHCIGDPETGSAWERCLLMLKCPFLALSATLGEPQIFEQWLRRIQNITKTGRNKYQPKVSLVTFFDRWSDLEKSMFIPRDPDTEIVDRELNIGSGTKLHTVEGRSHLVDIHPCASFELGVGLDKLDPEVGFPRGLVFSPKDSFHVFKAMELVLTTYQEEKRPGWEEVQKDVMALDPKVFFNALYVGKAEASQYEKALKKQMVTWLKQGKHDLVEAICTIVGEDLDKRIIHMENSSKYSCYDVNILSLLNELNNTDRLPALVFCLDQELCEELFKTVVQSLEKMEENKRSEEFTPQRRKEMEKIEKQIRKLQKELEKKPKKEKKKDKKDGDRQATLDAKEKENEALLTLEDLLVARQSWTGMDSRFTFIKPGEGVVEGEHDYWKERAIKFLGSPDNIKIRGAARGVGLHMEELPRPYKQFVETLFRYKHLKIVFTTGTLAMGINMPCKTVVFCGDSKKLTAIKYRQMGGRAGRRGYDHIGYVTFFGVTPRKISNLMTSSLISLHGHGNLSAGTALRTLCMESRAKKGDSKKFFTSSFKNILQSRFVAPRAVLSYQQVRMNNKYQQYAMKLRYRFSVEFLYRMNMLNSNQEIANLAGIAAHLHDVEPSNFVFCYLLENGYIGDLCKKLYKTSGQKNTVCAELLAILAHIFFRLPLHESQISILAADLPSDVNFGVALPPLVGDIKDAVNEYTARAVQLSTEFSKVTKHLQNKGAAKTFSLGKSEILPLSEWEFKDSEETIDGSFEPGYTRSPFFYSSLDLPKEVVKFAQESKGSSSTPYDVYCNTRELLDTLDSNIPMKSHDVPVLEWRDAKGRLLELNGYVYNFFVTQNYYTMLRYSGLSDTRAWYLLKKWDLLLTSIVTALRGISRSWALQLQKHDVDSLEDEVASDLSHSNIPAILYAFQTLQTEYSDLFAPLSGKKTSKRRKKPSKRQRSLPTIKRRSYRPRFRFTIHRKR